MTAEEIRKQARNLSERSAFSTHDSVNWLSEIAAQLAEHNETLDMILIELQRMNGGAQ